MKTTKKVAACFAVLLAVCGPAGAQSDPVNKTVSSTWDARLYNLRGRVFIQPNGGEKKWIPLTSGMPLESGDRIGTGKNSKVDVSLDDRGFITLNESTVVLLKNLRRKDTSFLVNVGRFLMKVSGLRKRAEALSIRTPAAVAAVRGTEFAVSYDTVAAVSEVSVFDEGQVHVISLDEDGALVGDGVMLGPRHEVRVKADMDELRPREMTDQKAANPDMAEARKRFAELKTNYKPLTELERRDMRKNVLSLGGGVDNIAGSSKDPRKYGEAQNGAQDENTAKKGERGAGADKGAQSVYSQAGTEKRARAAEGKGTDLGSRPGARSSDDVSQAAKRRAGDPDPKKGGDGDLSKIRKPGAGDDDRRKELAGDDVKRKLDGVTNTSLTDKTVTLSSLGETVAVTRKVDSIVGTLETRLTDIGSAGIISKDELRSIVKSAMMETTNEAALNQRLTTDLAARLTATQDTGLSAIGANTQTSGFPAMTNTSLQNTAIQNGQLAAPAIGANGAAKKKLVTH